MAPSAYAYSQLPKFEGSELRMHDPVYLQDPSAACARRRGCGARPAGGKEEDSHAAWRSRGMRCGSLRSLPASNLGRSCSNTQAPAGRRVDGLGSASAGGIPQAGDRLARARAPQQGPFKRVELVCCAYQ